MVKAEALKTLQDGEHIQSGGSRPVSSSLGPQQNLCDGLEKDPDQRGSSRDGDPGKAGVWVLLDYQTLIC